MRKPNAKGKKRNAERYPAGISRLIVQGYKSLARPEPYEIELRPLTLLAGANSSGKSSLLQPLLLLKQTLEAGFDPGPLLVHGPHVRFTSTQQILPNRPRPGAASELAIGFEVDREIAVTCFFRALDENRIELSRMRFRDEQGQQLEFTESLSHSEIKRLVPPAIDELRKSLTKELGSRVSFKVRRRRCFFEVRFEPANAMGGWPSQVGPVYPFEASALAAIHVPGLRGNPERSYQTTAVGGIFPGTFETYVASIIHQWQLSAPEKLHQLWSSLEQLELTWKVEARQLDATQVELRVGRLPRAQRGGARDLVNIADVGFGVSQILPVVVALLAAKPGQLVYLEQPEIHLHPKAQTALAVLLAEAAGRGVRVVAETHSALLLLAVQGLVAENRLARERVLLHWFRRGSDGVTTISTAELDEHGAYGDWPEDFGEIELAAQSRYLNAVEDRLLRGVGGR